MITIVHWIDGFSRISFQNKFIKVGKKLVYPPSCVQRVVSFSSSLNKHTRSQYLSRSNDRIIVRACHINPVYPLFCICSLFLSALE